MKKRNAKVFALFMSVAMAMPNVAAAMPVYAAPEFEDEADFGDKFEEEFEAEAEEEVEAEDTTDADDEFVEEIEDVEVVESKKDEDNTTIVNQGTCSATESSNVEWELRESGVLYLTAATQDEMVTLDANGKCPWDGYRDQIKEIYVDGPLKNISAEAFKKCENLTKVTLNKHIVRIEDSAFEDCVSLERVTYPSSDRANVEIYGAAAFKNCTSLTYLTFTQALTEINEFCFYNCKSLAFPNGLNLQGKITTIEQAAFWGCTSLTSLVLPANVKYIEGGYVTKAMDPQKGYDSADACSNPNQLEGKLGAFAGCTGLTSVEFKENNGQGIQQIGQFAFYKCTGLGKVDLPSTLQDIEEYAFEDCTGISTVTMKNSGVTELYGTFKRCNSLSSFTVIPDYDELAKEYWTRLHVIDKETFQSCTSLKTVDLAPKAQHYNWYQNDYVFGDSSFRDCTSLASIELPVDTIELKDRSFQGCTALTTINIPFGTEKLGKNVFFNDIKLDDIYIPETVLEIGANSFSCNDDAVETMRLMDVYYSGDEGTWADFVAGANDTAYEGKGITAEGNGLLINSGKNFRYKANKYFDSVIEMPVPQIKEVAYENGGMKISWDKVEYDFIGDGKEFVSPEYYHIYQNHDKDNTIKDQWTQQTPLWEEVAIVSGSEDEFSYNIEDVMKAGDIYSYRIVAEFNWWGNVLNSKLGTPVTYTIPVKDSDIIPVNSLTFADASISLKIGDSQEVPLVIDPVNATSVNYAWESENPDVAVATVSDDKKSVTVTAKKEGHTMISVTTPDGEKSASFIVYVVDPKAVLVETIKVSSDNVTVQADEATSTKVSITITPEDATGGFVWESENPLIATVKVADDEKSAQITGLKEGETKITVTSNNGVKATINVKVTAKEEIPQGTTPVVVEDADGKTTVYQGGKAVENYTGLAKLGTAEDAPFVYVENGLRNQEFTGFVDYDGASFYVSGGTMDPKSEGLKLDTTTDTWYYVGAGMVQNYTGLATYSGEWFYVENGKLNTTLNAFVEYDGGLFAVGAGRIISEYDGLMQDPQNTKTGEWYFFSKGQAQKQYTGLVQYNGAWFYIQSGKFDQTYSGSVVYDGATFNVVNGAVVQ